MAKHLCLATLILAGCSSTPATPAAPAAAAAQETATVVLSASPVEPESEPPAAEPAPPPPTVDQPPPPPVPKPCTWTGGGWYHGLLKPRLRFDPTSQPFAEVPAARSVTLQLPVGAASLGAAMEIDAYGVVVRGNVASNEIPLHPRRSFDVAECVIPMSFAKLHWLEGKLDAVRVSVDVDPRIRPVKGRFEVERPCSDLALDSGNFDPVKSLDRPLPDANMRLRGWRTTAVSVTPGGPVVAEVSLLGRRDDDIDVLEFGDKHARIIWTGDDAIVFGWVSRTALVKAGGAIGDAYGAGGLGLAGTGMTTKLRCPRDVPLSARVGGVTREVGNVSRETAIERVRTEGDWSVVSFPESSVQASPRAELVVPAAALAGCAMR